MSYARRSLVPGETLLYETRHHWSVLLGPLFTSFVLAALAVGCLVEVMAAKDGKGVLVGASAAGFHATELGGVLLFVAAIGAVYLTRHTKSTPRSRPSTMCTACVAMAKFTSGPIGSSSACQCCDAKPRR